MKAWNQEECKRKYITGSPAGITSHMLCAGERGKDSCMVIFTLLYLKHLTLCVSLAIRRGNIPWNIWMWIAKSRTARAGCNWVFHIDVIIFALAWAGWVINVENINVKIKSGNLCWQNQKLFFQSNFALSTLITFIFLSTFLPLFSIRAQVQIFEKWYYLKLIYKSAR